MRFTHIIAGAVTAGLVGLVPVAISSPASATQDLTTTTTALPSVTGLVYGDTFNVNSEVVDSLARSTSKGRSTLYTMEAGATTWTAVATANAGSAFYDVRPTQNASYYIAYSGYFATSTYEDNLGASDSAPFSVGVVRKVNIDNAKAKLTIKGKIKPDYKRDKVKIKIKKGKRYVNFRTIKTTNSSIFQVRLPAARGRSNKLFFKIIVPGNSHFLSYSDIWYTYTYRSAPTLRRVTHS